MIPCPLSADPQKASTFLAGYLLNAGYRVPERL
jgi:hypothetical protein